MRLPLIAPELTIWAGISAGLPSIPVPIEIVGVRRSLEASDP